MILRGALVPYIYTHARTAYDTGITQYYINYHLTYMCTLLYNNINLWLKSIHCVSIGLSLLRAMYFEYPHYDESYYYDRQVHNNNLMNCFTFFCSTFLVHIFLLLR